MILSKVISFTDDEFSTLLEDINKLFQYYIQVDEIDIEMFFFKDLSKKDVNVFVQSKCLRWDQFFVNSTDLNSHNFLLPIRWTSFF